MIKTERERREARELLRHEARMLRALRVGVYEEHERGVAALVTTLCEFENADLLVGWEVDQ
jgi:hypothetical protein